MVTISLNYSELSSTILKNIGLKSKKSIIYNVWFNQKTNLYICSSEGNNKNIMLRKSS